MKLELRQDASAHILAVAHKDAYDQSKQQV